MVHHLVLVITLFIINLFKFKFQNTSTLPAAGRQITNRLPIHKFQNIIIQGKANQSNSGYSNYKQIIIVLISSLLVIGIYLYFDFWNL